MVNVNLIIGSLLYLLAIASKIWISDNYGTSTRLITISLTIGSLFMIFAYLGRKKAKK